MENYGAYEECAVNLALEAGKILRDSIAKTQSVNWHIPTNFKIEMDNLIDELAHKRIRERFGDDIVINSEELSPSLSSDSKQQALIGIVDPIDGTIPYTRRTSNHYAVCVAFADGNRPVVGVTYAFDASRDELYVGVEGKGAFCNGAALKPSAEINVNRVLMAADCGKETPSYRRDSIGPLIERIYSAQGVAYAFSYGCASVPIAMTASGKLDAYAAMSLEPWDLAAGVILNREAGNTVTTLPFPKRAGTKRIQVALKEWTLADESILIANPTLHKNLVDFLR